MSLQETLKEMRESSAKKYPAEVVATMVRGTTELRESGISERALGVGAQAPSISLENSSGEIVESAELLKRGPLVVTFYRGVW